MKKGIQFALILGLAGAAFAQTAGFTAPKAGDSWALGSTQTIAWTWSGNAKVKLLLFRQGSGNIGVIKTGLQLSDAGCAWKVGMLENGQSVPAAPNYIVRIINIADASVLDIGPAFAIAGAPGQPPPPATQMQTLQITQLAVISPQSSSKSIDVNRPHQGEAWIPLKPYRVEWSWIRLSNDNSPCGVPGNCAGCPVDISVVPAPGSPGQQKVQLVANKCTGYASTSPGNWLYSGSYEGIVPNLASGSYVVRVALTANPGFFGDSKPFPVQSTLSNDSAVLLPDPMQDQADLALVNAIFDKDANVILKVSNMGDTYLNTTHLSFKIRTLNSGRILKQGERDPNINIKPNEEQTLFLTEWGGYRFDDDPLSDGRYVPLTTRPFILEATLSAYGDSNYSNNSIYKKMCLIQEADIGTKGEIQLTFGATDRVTITRGTSNKVHEAQIKWLSPDTFDAELEVELWNYGCAARTFDCWLYVDKQPGLLVFGGATLQPESKTTLKLPIKIKLPIRCGNHKLVFIADPKEHDNEPYPNSYMNNFIDATLTILCGGTFRGN